MVCTFKDHECRCDRIDKDCDVLKGINMGEDKLIYEDIEGLADIVESNGTVETVNGTADAPSEEIVETTLGDYIKFPQKKSRHGKKL